MEFTVGTVLEGTVKTITNYGAFVQLPGNRTGMVHISEISAGFVTDIRNHLTEGQILQVRVIGVDEKGKISLSAKPPREAKPPRREQPRFDRPAVPKEPQSFEDKLKQFMSESDSRISGCRQYEHKTKSRKR